MLESHGGKKKRIFSPSSEEYLGSCVFVQKHNFFLSQKSKINMPSCIDCVFGNWSTLFDSHLELCVPGAGLCIFVYKVVSFVC